MEPSTRTGDNEPVDLLLLKREVDALQVAVMGQRKPWYKDVSIILSVVALLFSFGTTFVSYVRTYSQDIQSARVELRGLLQRLASLPRENLEVTKKYESDQAAVNIISGYLNQENALLARQAAEIADRLPPEYVSATEYFAIGMALQNSYNVEGAKQQFTKAIDISTDMNDRVGALRTRGNLLFLTGQPEAGRVDFQRALDVFDAFPNVYNDYTKKSTHIWTELAWATSEAGLGARDAALQHVANAENNLRGLVASPGVAQLKAQIDQARTMLLGGNVAAVPSGPVLGTTVPLNPER